MLAVLPDFTKTWKGVMTWQSSFHIGHGAAESAESAKRRLVRNSIRGRALVAWQISWPHWANAFTTLRKKTAEKDTRLDRAAGQSMSPDGAELGIPRVTISPGKDS